MLSYCKIFFLTTIIQLAMSNDLVPINGLESKSNTSATLKTNLSKTNVTNQQTIVSFEGGSVNATKEISSTPTSKNNTTKVDNKKTSVGLAVTQSSTTVKVIPVSESLPVEEHKKTVPRKGVEFVEIPMELNKTSSVNDSNVNKTMIKINTNKTITTVKPKKPLITIGVDEEPFAPSHFVSSKSKNISIPKVPRLESYGNPTQTKDGSEYIAPIIGVILSVPLVAIIINVIYKRSKEWWHHRHYRRMDFLIDGMYNHS